MTAEQAREHVMNMYPGPNWRAKVRKMSDAQVIAIHLKEQAKAQEPKKPDDKPKENEGDDIPF